METQSVNVKVSECCPGCETVFEKSVDVVVDGTDSKVPLICSVCGEQFYLYFYLELTAYTSKRLIVDSAEVGL